MIQGLCTAGTVRVNNLANVEAALNVVVDVFACICFLSGASLLFKLKKAENKRNALLEIAGLVIAGMAAPEFANFAVGMARDYNLFTKNW